MVETKVDDGVICIQIRRAQPSERVFEVYHGQGVIVPPILGAQAKSAGSPHMLSDLGDLVGNHLLS